MKYLNNFNNFLILEKAELKYSNSALEEMNDLEEDKLIKIPLKELVYDSPKIISGLIILDIFNKLFPKNRMLNFRNWLKANFFNPDYSEAKDLDTDKKNEFMKIINDSFKGIINWNLDNILNENVEIMFKIAPTYSNFHGNFKVMDNNDISIKVNSLFINNKKNILIHELRHLTQYVNSILISIANNWLKETNPKNNYFYNRLDLVLKTCLWFNKEELFGWGKTKKIGADVNFNDFANYLNIDNEYKPWMSDLINKSIEESDIENLDYDKSLKKCWNWLLNNKNFNYIRKKRKEAAKDYWLHLQNKLKELK